MSGSHRRRLAAGLAFIVFACCLARAMAGVDWPLERLLNPPKTFDASRYATNGNVQVVFYEGLPYRGRETRVFAYYGVPKQASGAKVPAMVLVHGGGGSAFYRWVKFWNDRGYAAISMDTCGSISGNTIGQEQFGHYRHDWSGPAGWGGFGTTDDPVCDQWMYHAVADVILAHSLIRSLPGVDPDRIGLTGVSWGGIISCIAASVDSRFRFAAPVYGCGGNFTLAPAWEENARALGPRNRPVWEANWDPINYLPKSRVPFHWLVGTNDPWFSLPAIERSRAAHAAANGATIRIRMPHEHGAVSERAEELVALAGHYLGSGPDLPRFGAVTVDGSAVRASFRHSADLSSVRATVDYTLDGPNGKGMWIEREWRSAPARIRGTEVSAVLPKGTRAFYLNLEAASGLRSSSHVHEVDGLQAASQDGRPCSTGGWEPPRTTRRYVHPPMAERLCVLFNDAKLLLSEVRHEHNWTTRDYDKEVGNVLWFFHGKDDRLFDFRTAENLLPEDGVPLHGLRWREDGVAVTLETCCDFTRRTTAHGRFTVANGGQRRFAEEYAVRVRYGNEATLLGGYLKHPPDFYQPYQSVTGTWSQVSCDWGWEGGTLRSPAGGFISFSKPVPSARWDAERGELRFAVDLEPGASFDLDFAFGIGADVRPAFDATSAATAEAWRRELGRINRLPKTLEEDPERLRIVRNMVVQILQCFCHPVGCDYVLPRQGGLQRWVWPWDNMEALTALGRIGDFGRYVEGAIDFYFGLYGYGSGGYPEPENRGKIGPFGNDWDCNTANCLGILGRYCLDSGKREPWDRYRTKALEGFRWIMRHRVPAGAKDAVPGFFPVGWASDYKTNAQPWGFTDANNLNDLGDYRAAAEKFRDPALAEIRAGFDDYLGTMRDRVLLFKRESADKADFDLPITPDRREVGSGFPRLYHGDMVTLGLKNGYLDAADAMRIWACCLRTGQASANGLTGKFSTASDDPVMRHYWYTTSQDLKWHRAFRMIGCNDLADAILGAALRFSMSRELYVGERYRDDEPWFLPWSPNCSGSGRIIQMLLDAQGPAIGRPADCGAVGTVVRGEAAAPVSVTTNALGHALIDFGLHQFGWIEVDAPVAGDYEFIWGELLDASGCVQTNEFYTKKQGRIRCAVTKGTFAAPGRVRIPYESGNGSSFHKGEIAGFGTVMPFRWLEVVKSPFAVTKENVRQVPIYYPYDMTEESFFCDCADLVKVHDFCKHSIRATTYTGKFIDGDRERLPYEADSYITMLGTYAISSDQTLTRRMTDYLATHSTWPTEWKQFFIRLVYEDWMHSGETDLVRRHYRLMRDVKSWRALRRADGLIVTPCEKMSKSPDGGTFCDIVDWAMCYRDGFVFRPVNAVVNALHYRNLRELAAMARAIGEVSDAAMFESEAAATFAAYQTAFFDVANGRYRDGEGTDHATVQANAMALACGAVPADRVAAVADYVAAKGFSCSTYMAQFVLEAFFRAGRDETAIGLMSGKGARSWLGMMEKGATITPEFWDLTMEEPGRVPDMNHSWSTAPLNMINRFVLGVTPSAPGFASVRVAPQPGRLGRLKARVPTPKGAIDEDLRFECGRVRGTVVLPPGMTGSFVWGGRETALRAGTNEVNKDSCRMP